MKVNVFGLVQLWDKRQNNVTKFSNVLELGVWSYANATHNCTGDIKEADVCLPDYNFKNVSIRVTGYPRIQDLTQLKHKNIALINLETLMNVNVLDLVQLSDNDMYVRG